MDPVVRNSFRRMLTIVTLPLLLGSRCESSGDFSGPAPDLPAPDVADVVADESPWQVCVPDSVRCEGAKLAFCSADGNGWQLQTCPPGKGCSDGACELIRPNVVVLFDTSGSMLTTQDAISIPPRSDCSQQESEQSRLALAKDLFAGLFTQELSSSPRFALTHFPQRLELPQSGCDLAWHRGLVTLTDDDQSHFAPDEADGYFRHNLDQFVAVAYPKNPTQSNRVALLSWLDGTETAETTTQPCAAADECDATDFCDGRQCAAVTNPELRADGSTPLGKTLFYVGEYFRQAILVDGRFCLQDKDCQSPNYRCNANRCEDPLAHCRVNAVLVFTDGLENGVGAPDDFFGAYVQAKRLFAGLACQQDSDCSAGVACGPDHTCVQDDWQSLADSDATLASVLKFQDEQGADRLKLDSGAAVSLRVHVLDPWGSPEGRKLAQLGGGEYVEGELSNPQPILHDLQLIFSPKEGEGLCE